jgi:hypothetical protein
MGGERDHNLRHARHFLHKLLAGQAHRLQLPSNLRRFGLEDEGHAVALHVQRPHQVAGHHVAAIGQGQAGQGLQNALTGLAHVSSFLARATFFCSADRMYFRRVHPRSAKAP